MSFTFHKATNLQDAINKINTNDNSVLIAGGTDLMVKIRGKVIQPSNVVFISEVPEMSDIVESDDTITIGALVNQHDVAESESVLKYAGSLAAGAGSVGSVQIRNVATIGGNICNLSPAADTAPPIMVLNGKLNFYNNNGFETKTIEEFLNVQGKPDLNGMILVSITVDKVKKNQGTAFYKVGKRKALAISVINCATFLEVENGIVTNTRISLGSVAAKTIRIHKAEEWLIGKAATEENFEQAGKICSDEINPIDDVRATKEYRVLAAKGIVQKTLRMAYESILEV